MINSDEELERRADECVRFYELTMMNDDTPRMSGEHYMRYGYRAGWKERGEFDQAERIEASLKEMYANSSYNPGFAGMIAEQKENDCKLRCERLEALVREWLNTENDSEEYDVIQRAQELLGGGE